MILTATPSGTWVVLGTLVITALVFIASQLSAQRTARQILAATGHNADRDYVNSLEMRVSGQDQRISKLETELIDCQRQRNDALAEKFDLLQRLGRNPGA